MASDFLYPPSKNAVQKTLSAQLLNTASTTDPITFDDVDGIQNKPGVLVINRVDSNGVATASAREYISYSGTSGTTVLIQTRNVDGGASAKTHNIGAIVEFIPDVVWAQRMIDQFLIEHGVDGTHGATFVKTTGSQTLTGTKTFQDAEFTTSDPNLATGLNIQVNGADPWRTITLTPGFLKPTTTSGCATATTVEAGTNDIDYDVLDFDASSDENAFANFQMPDSWDGGVIQFRYIWTNAGGGAAETVVFELSGRSYADDDAIDQAIGTPVEVSDTWIAQGDIHISAWSTDVTITGATAGEWVHLEVMRDVSEDNLTGDARLIGVQLRYKQAQYSD